MSTNKTTRYKMHSWIGSDKVSRQEMVDNFTTIDNLMVANSTADVTYYVRPDGNDANVGTVNTAAGAFKTIQKAISMIPQVLNHTYNINLSAGTYNEDVSINGIIGKGLIYITGSTASPGNYNVKSFHVHQLTVYCNISGLTVTGTGTSGYPVLVDRCRIAILSYVNCTFVNTGVGGAIAVGASTVSINNSQLSGKHAAVKGFQNANIYCQDVTGANNKYAFSVMEGTIINTRGTIPDYTDGYTYTDNLGVINPVGNNTWPNRTYCFLYQTAGQGMAANTNTRLVEWAEYHDHLNEFDVNTAVFTAKNDGIYLVSARLAFNFAPAGTRVNCIVYVNGNQVEFLAENVLQNTDHDSVGGTMHLRLFKGDRLELYTLATSAISTESPWTRWYITRLL